MSHPFPSPSLQPVNPSALSRLGTVASPASAGSQQAINMLKEQNRLLTKVSDVWGEKIPLGRLGEEAGWDGPGEGIQGSGKCSFSLANRGHCKEGHTGCSWGAPIMQLFAECPWAGMGHPHQREETVRNAGHERVWALWLGL